MEAFFLALQAVPFVVAAVLGILVPILLLSTYNHFAVGLALVAVTAVFDDLALGQPVLRIGLTLFSPDVPLVILGAAAALRWLLSDDVPRRHWAWTMVALVFFVNLAIGLTQHGSAAGSQARPDYYAIATATYAMSFPMTAQRVRQLVTMLVSLALATVALSAYRWTVYYLPIPYLLPPGGVYNDAGATRVVGANSALVIVQAFLLAVFFGAAQGGSLKLARVLSPVLLAATLVLQHRSVWLAGIVGVLLSLLVARSQRAPLWQQLALLVLVVSAAVTPLFISDSISRDVQSSAASAVAGEGTVRARLDNWKASLEKWRGEGSQALVIGTVLGSDTTRYVKNEEGRTLAIKFFAHNNYVSTLTNYGVIGFAGLLWILAYVVFGLWRQVLRGDDDSPRSALLLVLVIVQSSYYVAYGVDFTQHLVLGAALAWVAGHAKTRRKAAAPDRMGAVVLPRRA